MFSGVAYILAHGARALRPRYIFPVLPASFFSGGISFLTGMGNGHGRFTPAEDPRGILIAKFASRKATY